MRKISLIIILWIVYPNYGAEMSPQEALQRLMQGNARYVNDALEHPNRNLLRRQAIVSRQTPFAIIMGCSDSRVSPEIIFDQGVGDLFIVRVAGNVIGSLELESIDYAVRYLQAALILVLGHENCGAIQAVIEKNTQDIESVAQLIEPSVTKARQSDPLHLWPTAVKINAQNMRNFLLNSSPLKKYLQEGKLAIHAAYYNLQTGAVEIL